MVRRSDQDAALEAVYAKIPTLNCKGHCKASCGPIDMSHRERARIRQQTGIKVPPASQMFKQGGDLTCPALNDEGRCGAYEVRPFICRAWGASEAMTCRWGCTTTDGQPLMTSAETYRLLADSIEAGGGCVDRDLTRATIEEIIANKGEAVFDTPGAKGLLQQGELADQFRAVSQEIPDSFVSGQVIQRYADAHSEVHVHRHRRYA